tara:strand:+ start:353 stop:559 length:207 start_codon:yes stop_codon:yes gene_type:complete
MPNRSNYESKLLRDESPGAAQHATRSYGTVNAYWVEQAAMRKARGKRKKQNRKRQAPSPKRQATSGKR